MRSLLRQRRRLLLAGLAIALGVGYLAGALGLLDRIGAGLDELATASADRADLVIEGDVAYESSLEQVRRLVPSSLADAALQVDGVKSASHRLEDVAVLVDAKGEPVVAPGLSEQPLGVNWPEDPSISTYDFTSGGPPRADDQVAIDSHSALVAGVGVGDSIKVAGKGKVGEYRISGIIDDAGAGGVSGSSLVVLSTDEARLVFDRPTDDNRVSVVVSRGADTAQVQDRLRALVPSGVEVVDGVTAAQHQQESLTRSFSLISTLVTGFAVLALLVGMLTVGNSLSLLHSQRRQLYASFRLAGARVGQLRRAAFVEAGVLALVASVLGVPLGVLLAVLIERALGALDTAVPTAGPLLSLRAVVLAVGLGFLATMVAAWRPVTKACRVTPVEAVRDIEELPVRRWSRAAAATSRAIILGVAAVAVALLASVPPTTVAAIGGAVAVSVLVISSLPWLLSRAVAGLISVLPVRPGPLRRIAARDAARNPRRTAASTAAVLLAVSVVTGLAVFLDSFVHSIDNSVDDLVTADLVVDSGTFTKGGLPGDLVQQLSYVEGVDSVSSWELGRGTTGQTGVRMTGLDGRSALHLVSPEWSGKPPKSLDPNSVWISKSLADGLGVKVGDSLPLLYNSEGYETPTVSGIYRSGEALLGDVVVDRTVLQRQVPATPDIAALVRTDGSARAAKAVADLAASYGVTSVLTPEQFVGSRAQLLRGFERVIQWMLLFTLLQALVGVVNTLVLSVGERRREFGLLRVSGASRRQVLRMVLFEGASLATVGTVIGLVIGVAAAGASVWALGSLGLGVFSIPLGTVVGVAVVAIAVGVVAAWVPARIAASVPPLEAVLDSGVEIVRGRPTRVAPVVVEPREPVPAFGVAPPPPWPPLVTPPPAPRVTSRMYWTASNTPPPAPRVTSRMYWTASNAPPSAPRIMSRMGSIAEPVLTDAVLASLLVDVVVIGDSGSEPISGDAAAAEALIHLYSLDPTGGPQVVEADVEQVAEGELVAEHVSEAIDEISVEEAIIAEAMIRDITFPQEPQPQIPIEPQDPQPQMPIEPAEPQPQMPIEPAASGPFGLEPQIHPEVPSEKPATGGEGVAQPEPVADRQSVRRGGRPWRAAPSRGPRRRSRRIAASESSEGWVVPGPSIGATAEAASGSGGHPGSPGTPRPQGSPPPDTAGAEAHLSDALRRLDPQSLIAAANALGIMGNALAGGEDVSTVICGRVREWPAALARTDRRLLVVVDRPQRPMVESLHPVLADVVVRSVPDAKVVCVAIIERGRVLELTDVRDIEVAESLVRRDALPAPSSSVQG